MAMESFTLKMDNSTNDETDHGRVYPLDVSCIYHPGAVTVLVELLPSVTESETDKMLHKEGEYQDALDLQMYVANKVQSCLRSERNQQVMCQSGLPQQILLHCEAALISEEHPLHLPLQRIFERLATQALTPVVLRDFMRLGNPLHCSEVEILKVDYKDTPQEATVDSDTIDGNDVRKDETPYTDHDISKLNERRYSVATTSSDIHKHSLIADFNESLVTAGNYFPVSRSRASFTCSSYSGEELSQGMEEVSEDSAVGSPPNLGNLGRLPKRMKPRSKSKSKFYAPSPSSSFDADKPEQSHMNGEGTLGDTVDGEVLSGIERGGVALQETLDASLVVTKQQTGMEGSVGGQLLESICQNGTDLSLIHSEHQTTETESADLSTDCFNSSVNPPVVISPSSEGSACTDNVSNESNSVLENKNESSPNQALSPVRENVDSCSEIALRQGGGPIPLSRIKCLVSMTTPRDMHLCGTTSLPGFVEFNMSSDGFGCLFFPSISPHVPQDTALVGSMAGVSSAMIGAVQGIGAGDRTFPPQAGVTFIAWLCVERFSSPFDDPHPIRLLTICSKTKQVNGTFREFTCLNIRISGMDRSLVVSTDEEVIGTSPVNRKSKAKNEARFPLQNIIQEGYWHHIIVTLNRALISKHSTATVYLDGSFVATEKLRYLQTNTASNSSFTLSSIDAYIGTRRSLRRCSRLIWQLGPCHFLEEPLQSAEAEVMYQLGPSYLGSFQAPFINKNSHSGERETRDPIVAEANIVFGVHAHATSLITIAKLKKHFSKSETRAVAHKLGLSRKDNSTPVRLIHNTAGHLQGPSRCLGGVIVGISGVRTFFPRPVAELISCVGGTTTLLGLVAMANDVEMLYASVKALSCVLRHSFSARQDMERIKGYQILALLFKRKCHLLNTHILHLTFALVGTVDSEREMSVIPNDKAFKDLLCDFEVWTRAPDNLQKSLFAHFFALLCQSSQLSKNVELMQDLAVVPKLLYVLKDETTTISTFKVICQVLTLLLKHGTNKRNLLRFGQFLAWTITSSDQNERKTNITTIEISMSSTEGKIESSEQRMGKRIILRNLLLEIILSLVGGRSEGELDEKFSRDVQEALGFDWIMLFMQGNLNCSTVVRALRLLVIILSESGALERFIEGSCNGGWLRGTETLSSKIVHVVGGFNVKAMAGDEDNCEVNKSVVNVPGFVTLNQLLSKHVEVPEIYHLIISLLLKHPVKDVDAGKQFDWDSLYHVFWVSSSSSNSSPPPSPQGPEKHTIYCAEAACVLLSMARMVCGKEWEDSDPGSWLLEYPVTVVQFLTFLYHNVEQFSVVSSSQEFVEHLVAVVFPEGKQVRIVSTDASSLQLLTHSKPRGSVVYCNDEKESLTRHPAKRLIMGFIRVLITDALTVPPFLKTVNLVDVILESFPASSKLHQTVEFQTEVLQSQMEYLLAGNLLANPGKVMVCIFSFTSKVVDKLWQDHFSLGYRPIFNFIIALINSVKGHSISKDGAFFSLNRVILYQLSKHLREFTDFMEMLEFLHLLTANYRIVFSSVNNDADFIASLCYLLLIMTGATLPESSDNIDPTKYSLESADTSPGRQDLSHSSALLSAAAERVWEVFIQNKKEVIENVFKMEFPKSSFTAYGTREIVDIPKNFKTMNLDPKSLGSTLLEPAKKIWDSFRASQIKHKTESPKPLVRVKRPTIVLGRKSKKEKMKKDRSIDPPLIDNSNMWTAQHVDLAKKLFQHQHRNYLQNYKLLERSISQEWSFREDDLTRVRGLWGPPSDSRLDKWMLDMGEGPCRMRKKMCQNDTFYDRYKFTPEVREPGKKLSKFKIPMSFDSRLFAMLANQKISALDYKPENKDERAINEMQASCSTESNEVEANENNDIDDQTIVKLLEAGEKIRSMFRCARVEGLDHAEGLFLFGQLHFYVVDGVTLLSSKEIKDIDSIPVESHDPIIPRSSHDSHRSSYKKMCSTWAYLDVREVHKRRYILQETALEVFSSDGRNHLLVFPKSVRNKVYDKMLSMIQPTPQSIAGQDPDTDVETGVGIFSTILGVKSVTQRWERGEISNFQYLMHLNTLAGRSYNDLMQYPVFPWIIADYESEELDLSNPATFRDLSKPMGAQTESRRKDFEKRFREWDDPNGETPPCHYATHYSSAMVVASYLVRMEPFAQHFLRLQDGHFDLPDRMFHCIKDAWLSASKTNMADIKELIPEFFYLPEFLLNENRFELGHKQSGVVLGDVVLPRWAKGDPREFIRLHRKALECDYVSSKLHLWIDLIFGCKQLGRAAAEAVNVFHHWFYEGSADISKIQDPLRRNATIGFINNFGQTPKQLFKKPHPSKKAFLIRDLEQSGTSFIVNADRFVYNFTKLVPSAQPIKEIKGPVGQILQSDKGVLAVKRNHALFPPPCNQYVAWGFGDLSLRIGQLDSDKIIAVMEDFQVGQVLCAACPDSRTLITGGTNTLVYVWVILRENVKDKRPQLAIHEVLYGHLQPVTCLAVSSSYNLIVSGSEDRTCIIWDLNKLTYVRQLRGHVSAISAISINNLTGDIVTCAATYLYLWSVNGQLIVEENTSLRPSNPIHCCAMSELTEWDEDMILTGDQDGVVKMWSIEYFNENAKISFTSSGSWYDETGVDESRNPSTNASTTGQNELTVPPKTSLAHVSRSPSEDYVMIDGEHKPTDKVKEVSGLWKRRLVLRSQLTMHTAFSREDNRSPAAVTAMLISKDHKKLFIGDARGRVYSWSVSDVPGRAANHWVKDDSASSCTACNTRFSLTERKHHCRDCGKLFCSKCSEFESKISRLGIRTPVRVCFTCYTNLKITARSHR